MPFTIADGADLPEHVFDPAKDWGAFALFASHECQEIGSLLDKIHSMFPEVIPFVTASAYCCLFS